jgi:hypothetical protein
LRLWLEAQLAAHHHPTTGIASSRTNSVLIGGMNKQIFGTFAKLEPS